MIIRTTIKIAKTKTTTWTKQSPRLPCFVVSQKLHRHLTCLCSMSMIRAFSCVLRLSTSTRPWQTKQVINTAWQTKQLTNTNKHLHPPHIHWTMTDRQSLPSQAFRLKLWTKYTSMFSFSGRGHGRVVGRWWLEVVWIPVQPSSPSPPTLVSDWQAEYLVLWMRWKTKVPCATGMYSL